MTGRRVKRIRLSLAEPAGVDRQAWPVTQGIPFADGDLERGAPVRVVTDAGEPLPTQAVCLATWRADGRHVKWLLLDFQVDLPAGQTRDVWLEYGPEVTPVLPCQSVTVGKDAEHTRIDTGAVQVDLRHGDGDFLAAFRVRTSAGWRNLISRRPGPYLYMADQRGRSCTSLRAAPAPSITVEDLGPLRSSVCVKGYHASDDGRRFCPYVLRMHFYAGIPDVRLFHTFLFDQDPERIELSEVGFRLPLDLGHRLRMAFGGEDRSHWATRFARGHLLQASDLEYRVERDGDVHGSGGRTRGWGSLTGDEGSVEVVVSGIWQEYPKGISIDREGVAVDIWPSTCGELLRFSTPWKEGAVYFGGTRDEAEFKRLVEEKPTAPLNLKSTNAATRDELLWVEEMVAKYAPDRPASYNDTGANNGFGAAKTTEFLLRFSGQAIPDESAEILAICVQEPVIASPDVSYACATGAMRMVAPFDPKRFPQVEQDLDNLFERIVVKPRQVLRTYGMTDYGDLMCSHSASPAAMWLYFRDDPEVIDRMKHCARSYNNEANDQLYALWGNYLHTGTRKYFVAAAAYGSHMADVDIIHMAPDGSPGGLIHYHSCHHWTGGGSPSHTTIAGLMLQYYLTGNRRILDVCLEVADWAVAHQEPCGILSNREGVLVREYTTPVANLMEFYQATWEHRYGDLARRSLKWLLLSMPEPGAFPFSIYTAGDRGDEAEVEQEGWHLRQAGGMTPQLLYDAVQLFGESDPIFKQTLLGMAHRYLWGLQPPLMETEALVVGPERVKQQDPGFNASLIAFAFELTEDPIYAAYCRYYLREHFPRRAQEASFTAVCWGSIIPPMMEAVRRAEAGIGAEALARIEHDWVQKVTASAADRQEQPPLASRPVRRSLGVIGGYDS
jgi:hypothetical protein